MFLFSLVLVGYWIAVASLKSDGREPLQLGSLSLVTEYSERQPVAAEPSLGEPGPDKCLEPGSLIQDHAFVRQAALTRYQ